jgi:regulator of protease activity HflC (stomatin/prohibitin superfamily)
LSRALSAKVAAAVATAVFVCILALVINSSFSVNDAANWQIHQSVFGKVTVIDRAGVYFNGWGTVYTYPRYVEYYYTERPDRGSPTDESIRTTFNDGGTAQVSSFAKIRTPIETDFRLTFHQVFRGDLLSIRDAVEAHLANCIKATGPTMSSTEHQTARKAEFTQLCEGMLADGLYAMRREVSTVAPPVVLQTEKPDGHAGVAQEPEKRVSTEIVYDETTGKPVIATESPLKRYGMAIEQFSILETNYDGKTLEQFAERKEVLLLTEKSKAEQAKFVQEKLRQKAEGEVTVEKIRQEGEKEKMQATVAAEKEAEVAEITKKQRVTEASQKVEVAEQAKLEAETLREIAEIKAKTAELEKQAQISEAEGKQKLLEIGGALSEEKLKLAELRKERDEAVAKALSGVKTPSVILNGSGGSGTGGDTQTQLLNMVLLRSMGILDLDDDTFTPKNTTKKK